MIDCQVHTGHLESLGARAMDRDAFILAVARLRDFKPATEAWRKVQ